MTVYLDNAATSFPKPPCVYEKLRETLERYGACPGRGSYEMARQSETAVEQARLCLAELLGVSEPERIVFTLNATDALNMAIKGLLRPGDHVVTTVMEHNSVARPLNALEQSGALAVTRVKASPEGFVDPGDIQHAITDRTRLVAVVHASNVMGTLQPIVQIGRLVRAAERIFLVDAAQTAGSVPIDVQEACVDLLAFPGHKALLGLPGTGGLYIGPRVHLKPWREGGTGILSEEPLQPDGFPLRFEAGSPNTLGIALLGEAVRFILRRGVNEIRTHEMTLTKQFLNELKGQERISAYGPLDLKSRAAVVSVNIRGWSPERVGRRLDERFQIAVRTGLHCAPGVHRTIGTFPSGTVRISPGCFTKAEEIDRCLQGLREMALGV